MLTFLQVEQNFCRSTKCHSVYSVLKIVSISVEGCILEYGVAVVDERGTHVKVGIGGHCFEEQWWWDKNIQGKNERLVCCVNDGLTNIARTWTVQKTCTCAIMEDSLARTWPPPLL